MSVGVLPFTLSDKIHLVLAIFACELPTFEPVSYTHLDVYKRQDLFVVHTEYPRFILNVEEEEVEWLDDLEGDDEETMADEATKVVEAAFKWCDDELAKYDDEEDDE